MAKKETKAKVIPIMRENEYECEFFKNYVVNYHPGNDRKSFVRLS